MLYPAELRTHMERVEGIEPSRLAWKARALPLSYTRKFGGGRRIRTFEGAANGFTVRPLWPLGNPSWSLNGAGDGTRTRNLLITSQLLFQLSYTSLLNGDLDGIRTHDL